MSEKPPLAYSIDDIIKTSPFGRTTIYKEIREGRLKVRKCGRRTVALAEDYTAWLSALPKSKEAA